MLASELPQCVRQALEQAVVACVQLLQLLDDPEVEALQTCNNLPQLSEQFSIYALGDSCYQSSLAPPTASSHAHVFVLI